MEVSSISRAALVTGGESGIGRASAIALARAGWDVAILYYHDAAAAAETAKGVTDAGRRAAQVQADVGSEAAVEAAFDAAVAALGPITCLVNSAGLNMVGKPVAEMGLDQWHRMFATDLDGVFLTSRRFVRDAHAQGKGGSIVNISSIHAVDVRAGGADYCAAKAGVKSLTETMALEEAPHGITVNSVAPGMILTPMNARAVEDTAYRRSVEANVPAGRAGTAEEVAALVAFLASPDARYINGATLTIDGALSLLLAQGA
ncbi:SDR family NAD(P)-dependent oxidoreductase [Sphingomonas sp. R-74633]|uniref:SDR family NAD(P)-dependent oxidoreductase n=1 Tax=Sphingomonas sp. R-74633 TaxID=2751188 RepID=UPI0035A0E1D0